MTLKVFIMCTVLSLWPLAAFPQGKDDLRGNESDMAAASDSDSSEESADLEATTEKDLKSVPTVNDSLRSDQKRAAAKKAYDEGRELVRRGDFVRACGEFEQALSHIRLPIILFAAAQCRKDLGHDVEALHLFSEALRANKQNGVPSFDSDFLTAIQEEAAFRNMEDLLKRFVRIEFIPPAEDAIVGVRVDGVPWRNIHIFAGRPPTAERENDVALSLESGKSPGKPTDKPIDRYIGVPVKRLDNMHGLPPTPDMSLASWWMQPGSYSFELTLKSGRKMFLKLQDVVAPENVINLQEETWPAYVVVEEIPPNTRLLLKGTDSHSMLVQLPLENRRKRDVEISVRHPGEYELVATRNGYREIGERFQLGAGQRQSVYLDFKEKPLLRKWQFWVGVGVAAVAFAGGAIPVAYAATH